MLRRARGQWRVILAGLACLLVVSCVTLTSTRIGRPDRGIVFSHEKHAEELGCPECHDMSDPAAHIPGHDLCEVCHDIDTDNAEPEECGMCHTNAEYTVNPRTAILDPELKFDHGPHLAAELECAVCHPDPEKETLPPGPLKPFCMDCHAKTRPELVECSVCHTQLSKDVIPTHRGAARIAHDAPQVWERMHGRESQIDPQYCGLCHDLEDTCESCHRKNPPQSHTVAWRRRGHGMRATFDRRKCSVCHEEDSCLKCHQNNKPSSHRGGWDAPLNRHCVSCHYPAQRTNCTVCHEAIEHRSAPKSPHIIGFYPSRCTPCHPGGNPYRAPHLQNSTVPCKVCHY